MTIDPGAWYALKLFLEHSTGWPMDTLHVMAGVLLQLLFAALFRVSLASWRPWVLVLVIETANEAYDLWFERWPSMAMQLGEGMRDILSTMILPTVLLLIAMKRPRVLTGWR